MRAWRSLCSCRTKPLTRWDIVDAHFPLCLRLDLCLYYTISERVLYFLLNFMLLSFTYQLRSTLPIRWKHQKDAGRGGNAGEGTGLVHLYDNDGLEGHIWRSRQRTSLFSNPFLWRKSQNNSLYPEEPPRVLTYRTAEVVSGKTFVATVRASL
jgi:hypothetical protein